MNSNRISELLCKASKVYLLQGLLLVLRASPIGCLPAPEGSISHAAEDLIASESTEIVNEHSSNSQAFLILAKQQSPGLSREIEVDSPQSSVDLDPKLIKESPVLQRWMNNTIDVAADIANEPSFRTRARLSYSNFPSTNHISGLSVGVEDVRLERTRLTVSASYQTSLNSDRRAWGTNLHYYMRPLGSYINIAPVVGYQHLKNKADSIDGVSLGFRLLFILSRSGGADVTLTQTWVAPGSDEEAGLSTLSFSYALNRQLRLSTELEKQNTKRSKDNRFGIGLEWML